MDGLYHYMCGLEREKGIEPSTLCLGSIGSEARYPSHRGPYKQR